MIRHTFIIINYAYRLTRMIQVDTELDMNTIYLLLIIVSDTGSSIEKIPQKSLQECQQNALKINEAKLPNSQGVTILCLSGIRQ